jgi:hypothetical protein
LRKIIEVIPKCTMCGNPIPADHPRKKKALTCSDTCRDLREDWRRSNEDAKRCRYCLAPSSPAERSRYQRWRRFEKKNPPPIEELSPEEIEELEYKKANPPQKRGPRPKPQIEEHDNAATVSD